MNKKQQTILIIVTIILMIITGIGGFILGQKFYNKEEEFKENLNDNKEETNNQVNKNENTQEGNNNQTNENKDTKQEALEKIISNQLYALVNKKSLEELTNQERLRLLFDIYKDTISTDTMTVKISDLKEIHKKSSISNLDIEYTDIYDYYTMFSSDERDNREIGYKYNKDNQTYTYTGALGHGASQTAIKLYTETILFTVSNNDTYTIKQRYVFGNKTGDGPMPYILYHSGIDAYNEKNEFKKFNEEDGVGEYKTDYITPATEYIVDNYDTIKDKLSTYTYTFKKENNQYIIVDFKAE